MKTRLCLFACGWLMISAASCWAQAQPFRPRDLADLEVFRAGFPRTLLFRSGDIERWHKAGVLDQLLTQFNGNTIKYAGEEARYSPTLPAIEAAFKTRHPQELCLLHLNGEARLNTRTFTDRYFPGHWITYAGEILKRDLAADATVIPVTDPQIFVRRQFSLRKGNQVVGKKLPSVLIVSVDEQGNRLWDESEYAQITAVDPKGNTITVERGQYGSEACAFRADRSYVAPMHCEDWNGMQWTLNVSTACPPDRNGETAADIYLREVLAWCGEGGPAAHVDGIGFDVIYYLAKFDGWDLDNDGNADDGIAADGRRLQLEGVDALLKRLRAAVGPDFLLTSDGWEPRKQRAVGTFNGIESEGLCAPNDAWRNYARTLNTHTFWNLNNTTKYLYSYITAKMMDPDDAENADHLRRLGLATACALGVSYTGPLNVGRIDGLPMIPEMHQGQANRPNWLGLPSGDMTLMAASTPDLLEGQGKPVSPALAQRIEATRCAVSVDAQGNLVVSPRGSNPYETMQITLKGIPVTEGDLFVRFEAMAVEPLTGFDRQARIPRLITLHAEGLPTYEGHRGRFTPFNDTMALMGTAGFTPQYGYFRHAGAGRGSIDLTFIFEDQAACVLRNFSAHNAPMAIVREFENGVVVLNASQEALTLDLAETLTDPASPALRRLQADPAAYHPSPSREELLSHNDGRVEDPSRVTVPPLDALFLEKAR